MDFINNINTLLIPQTILNGSILRQKLYDPKFDNLFNIQIEYKGYRHYTSFSDHKSMLHWYYSIIYKRISQSMYEVRLPSVYEIIPNTYQKFRLDLDSYTEISIERLINICRSIDELLSNTNLIIYSSCGIVSNKFKWSFHIIETTYKFIDCNHVLYYVNKLHEKYNEIDTQVYKTTQMFRIELSSKFNQRRPKIRIANYKNNIWTQIKYDNSMKSYKDMNLLLDGLITYTRDCKIHDKDFYDSILNKSKESSVSHKSKESSITHKSKESSVSHRSCKEFLLSRSRERLMSDKSKGLSTLNKSKSLSTLNTSKDFSILDKLQDDISGLVSNNFKIRSHNNNLILLDRLNPTYCKQCKREHQKENPYIIITENNEYLLYCRRSDNNMSTRLIHF